MSAPLSSNTERTDLSVALWWANEYRKKVQAGEPLSGYERSSIAMADEIERLTTIKGNLYAALERKEERIKRLESPPFETSDEARRLRKQMGEVAVLLLQNDREAAIQWARGVKLTFRDGEPELAAEKTPVCAKCDGTGVRKDFPWGVGSHPYPCPDCNPEKTNEPRKIRDLGTIEFNDGLDEKAARPQPSALETEAGHIPADVMWGPPEKAAREHDAPMPTPASLTLPPPLGLCPNTSYGNRCSLHPNCECGRAENGNG